MTADDFVGERSRLGLSESELVLRGAVFTFLDDHEIVPFDRADAVADRLLELAKATHAKLVKA